MADFQTQILRHLGGRWSIDTLVLTELLKEDHQKIIGAVNSLQSLDGVLEVQQLSHNQIELSAEGKSIIEKGSHEAIVFSAVPCGEQGIRADALAKSTGAVCKIGLSKAIRNGWLKTVKDGNIVTVVRLVDAIEDGVQESLQTIENQETFTLPASVLVDLKKRRLLTKTLLTYYVLRKGPNFTLETEKLTSELTPDMIINGQWRQVRTEFRSILLDLEMGFSEMPTNRFVESSFWNFDALYVPRKHPARDAQDTFFMSQPEKCTSIPKAFMERVRAAHTGEDFDTLGYGPVWKKEESYKNCMRTHTTAVSARMLYEIGSRKMFQPSKLFSIDRVFRNETLDATHLAEFFQVEGVVADYNLNLGNLIGFVKEFFSRLGIGKIRFKPAYNPYTEPSMEVFCYHDGLKRWVEVGNSGMFRPEMLLPMGIPKDVRVIAWGLSLERPTMIRYGIDNIRNLVGHRVDLHMVYNNPICRFNS